MLYTNYFNFLIFIDFTNEITLKPSTKPSTKVKGSI